MVTIQEKQKYCNILKVRIDASQEEIAKAYKKMALKYHPDRNHGKEEWAKQEFIKVGEAYSVLSGKQESGSSNRFSSDAKFKEFEEMFNEVKREFKETEREFKETEREFKEYEENKNQEDKATRSKVIRDIEESLTSSNVSISELDSSLWSPYGDWKEKVENSVGSEIDIFSGDMRIAINRVKWKKTNDNNSKSGQGDYNYGNYSGQNRDNYGKHGDYGNPPPNYFGDKNFSPNNNEWTGENKSFSTSGDKIAKLRGEIEWNKRCLLEIYDESEKQRCQKMIAKLEKELRKLEGSSNSDKGEKRVPNPSSSSPGNYDSSSNSGDNNNRKGEKIKKLEDEIEQLKKSSEGRWNSRQKKADQKKIAEKEQELSELKKDNEDNDNDELNEQLINELINEVERLRGESKDLKDEKNELSKKS